MCGLFGMFSYGNKIKQDDINSVIASLGHASCERGTDATGIAYIKDGKVEIKKDSKPAYKFNFKLPVNTNIITGHTRLATKGVHTANPNNHPFLGNSGSTYFALAHNGMIHNEAELNKKFHLPKTKIETDSYIAVQMLERNKELSLKTIADMAEQLEGSFCFTILDKLKNLYIVKGSNPIALIHSKDLQAYFYASTEEILWKGIISSSLFKCFKDNIRKNAARIEGISLTEGDILQMSPDSKLTKFNFNPFISYCTFRGYTCSHNLQEHSSDEYVEQLKDVASCFGYEKEVVEYLLDEGYSYGEIEELIYCGEI